MYWSSLTNIKFHEKYRESISPPVFIGNDNSKQSRCQALRKYENFTCPHESARLKGERNVCGPDKMCWHGNDSEKEKISKKGEGKVFARKHIWVAQIGENSCPIIFLDKRNIEQMHGNEMKGKSWKMAFHKLRKRRYHRPGSFLCNGRKPTKSFGLYLYVIWQAVPSNLSTITIHSDDHPCGCVVPRSKVPKMNDESTWHHSSKCNDNARDLLLNFSRQSVLKKKL